MAEAADPGCVIALDVGGTSIKSGVVCGGSVLGAPRQTPLQEAGPARDYLAELRRTMGAAAREMTPFDEAYAHTDWSRWRALPMFDETHRANAYNTYLLMERQAP